MFKDGFIVFLREMEASQHLGHQIVVQFILLYTTWPTGGGKPWSFTAKKQTLTYFQCFTSSHLDELTCSMSLSRSTFLKTVNQNSGMPLGSSFSSSFFSSSNLAFSFISSWFGETFPFQNNACSTISLFEYNTIYLRAFLFTTYTHKESIRIGDWRKNRARELDLMHLMLWKSRFQWFCFTIQTSKNQRQQENPCFSLLTAYSVAIFGSESNVLNDTISCMHEMNLEKQGEKAVFCKRRSMQVYTSPVPAYLLSALPPRRPSIHIPHLWAHTLLSLCHFSAKNKGKHS